MTLYQSKVIGALDPTEEGSSFSDCARELWGWRRWFEEEEADNNEVEDGLIVSCSYDENDDDDDADDDKVVVW